MDLNGKEFAGQLLDRINGSQSNTKIFCKGSMFVLRDANIRPIIKCQISKTPILDRGELSKKLLAVAFARIVPELAFLINTDNKN
jgi:hypothetical protein